MRITRRELLKIFGIASLGAGIEAIRHTNLGKIPTAFAQEHETIKTFVIPDNLKSRFSEEDLKKKLTERQLWLYANLSDETLDNLKFLYYLNLFPH